jgi:hypothetical protein
MIVKHEIDMQNSIRKSYRIGYRKDKRYHWDYVIITFYSREGKWLFSGMSHFFQFFDRDVLLKIESIMRGLNS